jgi:hypothetical protein
MWICRRSVRTLRSLIHPSQILIAFLQLWKIFRIWPLSLREDSVTERKTLTRPSFSNFGNKHLFLPSDRAEEEESCVKTSGGFGTASQTGDRSSGID